MISNSPSLQNLTLTFVITVTCYNCMAVYVTKYLSAIWHAILGITIDINSIVLLFRQLQTDHYLGAGPRYLLLLPS